MANEFVCLNIDAPGQIESPRLSRLYGYWRAKAGDAPRPAWSDFELMDVYDIAPYIMIKDVTADGRDFFYRYWGSRLTEVLGYEMRASWRASTSRPSASTW